MRWRVAGIHPRALLAQAVELMAFLEISALPVMDVSGVLVGIVTDGDVVRRAVSDDLDLPNYSVAGGAGRRRIKTQGRFVEDVMTPALCAVQAEASLAEVTALMKSRGIKCLPVLSDGKLVGIIHASDLAEMLGAAFEMESEGGDAREEACDLAIKNEIGGLLRRLEWTAAPLIDVNVKSGNVELAGTLLRAEDRPLLRKAIERLPGVASYKDQLVLTESSRDLFAEYPEDEAGRQKLYC
jgi:CBS domain-containing protein